MYNKIKIIINEQGAHIRYTSLIGRTATCPIPRDSANIMITTADKGVLDRTQTQEGTVYTIDGANFGKVPNTILIAAEPAIAKCYGASISDTDEIMLEHQKKLEEITGQICF